MLSPCLLLHVKSENSSFRLCLLANSYPIAIASYIATSFSAALFTPHGVI